MDALGLVAFSGTLLSPFMLTSLADFTSPALICPELRGEDSVAVIRELSDALSRAGRVPNFQSFYDAVLSRESLVSTQLEPRIALPHARIPDLDETSFALGRKKLGLRWSAHGLPSVTLVFLVAVPSNDCTQYLSLISGLARLTKEAHLMERLLAATDTRQIFDVLGEVNLKSISSSRKAAAAQR